MKAYGALTPRLSEDTVKVYTLNRFDKLREQLLYNAELVACRRSLEAAGFASDLTVHGLGPGNMFVRPEIAWSTILALQTYSQRRTHGRIVGLGCRSIVISREFDPTVRELIRACGPRAIFVVSEDILGLREMGAYGRPPVTCSTNPDTNPRIPQRQRD